MRVLITGIPLFSKRLAEDLQAFDPKNKYVFFDTYSSKLELLKFLVCLPFYDKVISLNGVTDKSGTLDWVVRFKKKLVLQWTGTDALIAMEHFKNGTISRKYIDYAVNWVDSPWLLDEIKSIELKPEYIRYKYFKSELVPVEKYDKLKVVTYIAQKRQEFYGLPWVVLLAENNPEIDFVVFGVDQPEISVPSNVICKGWQPSEVVIEEMRNAPISVRFTKHDGYSVAAIEALSMGAEVLNSLPMERTHHVNEENLLATFTKVCTLIEARNFVPNLEQRESVLAEFDQRKVLGNYIEKLKQL